MSAQAEPYLSTYLRKSRIPDTAVILDPGDQSKTLLPPRRRPRVRKDLDAGALEAEVGSFALHMAAEGKAPRTIGNYTEAVRWFAAACAGPPCRGRGWLSLRRRAGVPGPRVLARRCCRVPGGHSQRVRSVVRGAGHWSGRRGRS